MTVSGTQNGMLAVIQAMADADAAGFNAQRASIDDLSSAAFMEGLQKILSDFGNDAKAVETFLQTYLAGHATGEARDRMTTQSGLILPQLEQIVGKLKDYDSQISDATATLDKYTSDVDALGAKVGHLTEELAQGYGGWYSYFLDQIKHSNPLLLIMPITYATVAALAAIKLAEIGKDFTNTGFQLVSATKNRDSAKTKYDGLEQAQLACASGNTGAIGNHASGLSGPAHSTLDNVNHLTALGFMFVKSLQDGSSNNNE